MELEWDPAKAESLLQQHGIDFADAVIALEDPLALSMRDPASYEEERFSFPGHGSVGSVARCGLHDSRRADSADLGPPGHRPRAASVRGRAMRKEYDFSGARRGPVVPSEPGKTRITIRLDNEVLAWFKEQVRKAGGGNYQTLINAALQEHVQARREPLETTLRRVITEELKRTVEPCFTPLPGNRQAERRTAQEPRLAGQGSVARLQPAA